MTKNNIASAAAGSYVSVNGLNMYYEIHGAGQPLVLLAIGRILMKFSAKMRRLRQA